MIGNNKGVVSVRTIPVAVSPVAAPWRQIVSMSVLEQDIPGLD